MATNTGRKRRTTPERSINGLSRNSTFIDCPPTHRYVTIPLTERTKTANLYYSDGISSTSLAYFRPAANKFRQWKTEERRKPMCRSPLYKAQSRDVKTADYSFSPHLKRGSPFERIFYIFSASRPRWPESKNPKETKR